MPSSVAALAGGALPRPASLVRRMVGSASRRGGGGAAVEAGGDDGDPDLVGELLVDVGAEDDVGVGMGGLADHLGRLGDLDQREVGAAGDREQDRARPLHRGLEHGEEIAFSAARTARSSP